MSMKLKIKKGDRVVVRTGKNKGTTGEVIRVMPNEGRALVRGVNMSMRHKRQTQTDPGGRESQESPIQISNLALVDPKTGDATRVGYKTLEDGRKVRFAKKSGEVIDV